MKRINAIIKYIKPNSVIADIGSDHALLSTSLIKCMHVKHIYNVEKNVGPLKITINNTREINNISNVYANGLNFKTLERRIDYCVIAGMGGLNIINIMNHPNCNKYQTFILQPNNNTSDLRHFLMSNGYFVVCEEIIEEKGIYYDLLVVSKHEGIPITNEQEIFFGPYNLKYRTTNFNNMYMQLKMRIINNNLNKLNRSFQAQLQMINNL